MKKNYGLLVNQKIKDLALVNEIIFEYNEGNFEAMRNLINEYEPHFFFQDLYQNFDNQPWRSLANKYLNFVGISICYHEKNFDYEDLQKILPGKRSLADIIAHENKNQD
jgi:hypothetical protein